VVWPRGLHVPPVAAAYLVEQVGDLPQREVLDRFHEHFEHIAVLAGGSAQFVLPALGFGCVALPEGPQVGDLLALFLYVDSVRNVLFKKAFISQAKKSIGDIFLENCQTCLYEKEKEFIYARFKGLKGKRRKLPSYPRRCFALNYLILDVEQDIPNPFFVSLRHRFGCAWDLLLFNTLIGSYGLSFGFNIGYGWSKIIWDLIEVAGSSVYGKRGDRGCYLSEFLAEFNDFGDYEKAFIKSEGNGEGIPILLIIVQDKEL